MKQKNSLIGFAALLLIALLGFASCAPQGQEAPNADDIPLEKGDQGESEPLKNGNSSPSGDTPNGQDASSNTPSASIKTRAGDLVLSYQNGIASLEGTLQRSTPCVNWQIASRVMESFPEQVIFEINDASTAQMCIQVLGEPQEVSSSVEVFAQASYRVLFRGEEVFSGQLS